MTGEASARQVATVISQLNSLQAQQQQVSAKVGELASHQELIRSEIGTLSSEFAAFLKQNVMDKNRAFAQTQLIDVRAQLQTEFGHYGEVRRSATGILQATDAGIVTMTTVRNVSEELMILNPRYWLAPALVALAAWIRDDQALAEKALAEALRRDNDKTALFFALILRRHQRTVATARWLDQYISRQDPGNLAREFVVVLDAVATGALGAESRSMVLDYVAEWFDTINAQESVKEAQIARWVELLDGMRAPVDSRYTILPQVSPTWGALKELYEGSTVHGLALAHLTNLFSGEVVLSFDQRKRVDDILESLVSNYDDEERPARREEARLELVVKHMGDHDAAERAMAGESQTQDERVDILTLLTNAAFFPEKVGASKGTQRMATAMAHEWISEADGRLALRNTERLPAQVKLKIEGWEGAVSDNATEAGLTQSLRTSIDHETEQAVAKIKFAGGPLIAALVGGALLLLAIVVMASGGIGFGVFLLIAALGLGGWAYYGYSQLPARRQKIRDDGERRKVAGTATLKGAISEVVDLRGQWEVEAKKTAELHKYVATLTGGAHAMSASDEGRAIAS